MHGLNLLTRAAVVGLRVTLAGDQLVIRGLRSCSLPVAEVGRRWEVVVAQPRAWTMVAQPDTRLALVAQRWTMAVKSAEIEFRCEPDPRPGATMNKSTRSMVAYLDVDGFKPIAEGDVPAGVASYSSIVGHPEACTASVLHRASLKAGERCLLDVESPPRRAKGQRAARLRNDMRFRTITHAEMADHAGGQRR